MNTLSKRILDGEILTASLNGDHLRRVAIGGTIVEGICLDLALLHASRGHAPQSEMGMLVASGWADQLLLWGYSFAASLKKGKVAVAFHRESVYALGNRLDLLPGKFRGHGDGLAEALADAFGEVAGIYEEVASRMPREIEA